MTDSPNTADLFAEASRLHQAGEVDKAMRLYRAIVSDDPNHAAALTRLGTLSLQKGRLEQGIELLDRSLAIDPNQAQALNNRGNALGHLNRNEEALSSFENALAARPDYAEALDNRGVILYRLNQLEEALQSHDRAIALKPDYPQAFNNRGNVLYLLGRAEEAISSYDRAIELSPGFAEAYANRGRVLGKLNRNRDAVDSYERAVALKPDYAEAFYRCGTVLYKLHRLDEALRSYGQAIELKPEYAEAFNNRGTVLFDLNRLEDALRSFERAIALSPDYAEALNNRAAVLLGLKRPDEALLSCERAIALRPNFAEAFVIKGSIFKQLKRYESALSSYDRALALKHDNARALNNRGSVFFELKQLEDALSSYQQALELQPDYAEAYYNRGIVLAELKRSDEALADFDRAIALKPDYAEAFNNRGTVLFALDCLDKALASYERAIELNPASAEVFNNRGIVHAAHRRYDKALLDYERAIELEPNFVEALANQGSALNELKRPELALLSYERAFSLNPDFPYLAGAFLHNRMKVCDMSIRQSEFGQVLDNIDRGKKACIPFPLLAMPSTSAQQQHCAEIFMQDRFPPRTTAAAHTTTNRRGRIRLGYFSADFHEHPVSYLAAEIFELHSRGKFEVFGFSIDPTPDNAVRNRLRAGFDHYVDAANRPARDVAEIVQEAGIDIAIDLGGHTSNSPLGILAYRPAPVQVHFLGYPGTVGAPYIDYLMADRTVIPGEGRAFYSERIAYLPGCFLPRDSTRQISARVFSREELGLPAAGFVFCCFNNQYKITPSAFRVWMRLLKSVPDSVLWLSAGNSLSAENLHNAAVEQGVAAERIVFAKRFASSAEHLARHRAADLFVDTFPYNAHTTASDALWAGLPLVTIEGDTFAGRVAASLLRTIGLPEMITQSVEGYEALALELALQPEKLAAVRQKLWNHRLDSPLFDMPRFTRNLESAYVQMWQRHQHGLEPEDLESEYL